MKYWTYYQGHKSDIRGKKNKFDNNIYTFDIETSSYLFLKEKQLETNKYNSNLSHEYTYNTCMYVWQFGINENVYYGRTWEELKKFMKKIDDFIPEKKIIFIHNLSFEFQYLRSVFTFTDVIARTQRKVMRANIEELNYEFRCTYYMTNTKLEKLPSIYGLPVEKLVDHLDYSKIRTSVTHLTEEELEYCENDCLVLYYYLKKENDIYGNLDKIPLTSTGKVRRELKSIVLKDPSYRNKVYRAINTDPHIYNLLVKAFQGGYTHASYYWADIVLKNVTSYDFTSSYPYVMVTHKYPSNEFKKCYIKTKDDLLKDFAYLLVVKFKNVKSNYFNNFISASKCENIKNAKYDNGRIISADEFIMTITDIDFKLYLDAYSCDYEIIESYYSRYNYLPKQFIDFILEKYVNKTKFKNVEGKELDYQLEKAKFNSLYGMSVTNTIRDKITFDTEGWHQEELTNDEIQTALFKDKKQCFLSFAYGVWVTAYARNNLLKNVMKLDEYVAYCDTDSIKLLEGYDEKVITEYNEFVKRKIRYVSKTLDIPIEKFEPSDSKGIKHMLGLFESDGSYEEFITQGAKKYAVKEDGEIHITVAGVPKKGAKVLNNLKEFKDNLIFPAEITNKLTCTYIDSQEQHVVIDYQGNSYLVKDKTGCCFTPASYELGKSLDYAELISDYSSKRSIYKEVK
jgi:hypothetical protein